MSEPQITHWEGCWLEGLSHYGCAIAHIASLTVRAERGDARIAHLEALLGEAPHSPGCASLVCAYCDASRDSVSHYRGHVMFEHEIQDNSCDCFKAGVRG